MKFGDLTIERNLRVLAANTSFIRIRPEDGVVFLCAWCPGYKELTEKLKEEGHLVDHGMHPECAKRLFQDYRKTTH